MRNRTITGSMLIAVCKNVFPPLLTLDPKIRTVLSVATASTVINKASFKQHVS